MMVVDLWDTLSYNIKELHMYNIPVANPCTAPRNKIHKAYCIP